MFTTWEEWLDAPSIPLGQIAPLIICGPRFESCELTRAGMCAVQMRGLSILEQWQNLRDSGLCLGIENARAVDRLNKLMGLDALSLARGGNTTLEKFVEWAQSKRSITLPQELLKILNGDLPRQDFERTVSTSLVNDSVLLSTNNGDSTVVRRYEYDVALSFAGEDRTYVDEVANILKSKGIKVFYDLHEQANLWGKDLYRHLSEVYRNKAKFLVMFISAKYKEKLWPQHECKAAQAREFEESDEYILPARFDETEISGIHRTVGYIDLTKHSPVEFAELIIEKLVLGGCTIPSETIRKDYSSTTFTTQVDPLSLQLNVKCEDTPVEGCTVVAIAENGTYLSAVTNELGIAKISVSTRRMYDLLVAHPKYPASIIKQIDPDKDINITLQKQEGIGSLIIHSTGYIPELSGRLNPILDTSNRMYLYAANIAVDGGKTQPVTFEVNIPIELEDASGKSCLTTFKFIKAETSLLQYLFKK